MATAPQYAPAAARPQTSSAPPALRRACACGQYTPGGAPCAKCQANQAALAPSVAQTYQSPGHPLERQARTVMEQRFGREDQPVQRLLVSDAEKPTVSFSARAAAPAGFDFTRIPAYTSAARKSQTNVPGEGETIGDEAGIPMEGNPVGEAEFPADFVGPLQPGDTRAVPHDFAGTPPPGAARSASFHPTITVVTPGRRTSDCGGYTYKVRWGIPAAERASAGWIVQKVTKRFEATDCAGKAVAPQAFDNPAGYPFWEAWEFTAGQKVWVGPASGGSPHSGDTFSGADYGPGTKGKKTVTGEVKAIVGFALPSGMTARNAAPAWALPYTRSEPAQFASTLSGASHTLTSEWNCCPSGTVTKATTVATNP